MNDRTLNRLFRRFVAKNDGAALAAVFDATARELLDVACHLMRDAAAAEDVVQETYLAAIRGAQRWDRKRPVKAWLYGILEREAAKARRSAARATEPVRLAERGESLQRGGEPDPIDAIAAGEVPAEVDAALRKLPRHYREVLTPLVQDGTAPEEIARDLGRAPGTVRSQIHRGLERLRRLLPGGMSAASGFAFLPSGSLTRGLDALRGEVLSAAGFTPAVAVAAAPVLVLKVQAATLGALFVTKTAILMGAAAVAAGLGLWGLLDDGRGDAERAAPTGDPTLVGAHTVQSPGQGSGLVEPEDTDELRVESTPANPGAAEPATEVVDPLAHWLARFNEAPDDWRHGWNVAGEIAQLPPDEARAVMTGCWPHLTKAVKEQALKPFVFGDGHPHALPLLHLAATDAELSVQSRAFTYLKGYAFRDFTLDYDAYLAWNERWSGRPLSEVLDASARELAYDLATLPPNELAERLVSLDNLDLDAGGPVGVDLAAVIRDSGGLNGLATALRHDDIEATRTALSWSKTLGADEGWLRAHVLPVVLDPERAQPRTVDAYFRALDREDCAWAQPAIVDHLVRISATPPDEAAMDEEGGIAPPPGTYAAASALAGIGDPTIVPRLIEVIANDTSGTLDYAIGHFALGELTGVRWQEGRDAAWWLDWLEKNRARFTAGAKQD